MANFCCSASWNVGGVGREVGSALPGKPPGAAPAECVAAPPRLNTVVRPALMRVRAGGVADWTTRLGWIAGAGPVRPGREDRMVGAAGRFISGRNTELPGGEKDGSGVSRARLGLLAVSGVWELVRLVRLDRVVA